MDNAQSVIQAYQTGFKICIILGFVALAATVAMFFLFDIRTIILLRTNRAQSEGVRRIRKRNGEQSKPDGAQIDMNFSSGDLAGRLPTEAAPVETTTLTDKRKATTTKTGPLKRRTAVLGGTFRIVEEIMVVHSDEII